MSDPETDGLSEFLAPPRVETVPVGPIGTFPNNDRLPLLLYPGALIGFPRDPASVFEAILDANGWDGAWRDGIYPFHHYHSLAHEVLGVFGGMAEIQFGGPRGPKRRVLTGDVVVIPAGVSHSNLGGRDTFAVVGAYPDNQCPDLRYGEKEELDRALGAIKQVALPTRDPLYGADGPMFEHWK